LTEISEVILELSETGGLPDEYSDHQLHEQLANIREFHVLDDLLITYRIKINELLIMALDIGSHYEIL
jgi:addiction module RelE/StbE family toxin